MTRKFLEGVSSKLAERWVATLLTPAFLFWTGGAITVIHHFGWICVQTQISVWVGEPSTVLVVIAAFCLVTTSAFVVQRFDLSVLRFLEGYWHPWIFSPYAL